MFELLACDKKFIFDFFALFVRIKPASLCPPRIKQRPSSHTVLKNCKNWIRFFGWFLKKWSPWHVLKKFFPRSQDYSSTYSVRDKFTAVDI